MHAYVLSFAFDVDHASCNDIECVGRQSNRVLNNIVTVYLCIYVFKYKKNIKQYEGFYGSAVTGIHLFRYDRAESMKWDIVS